MRYRTLGSLLASSSIVLVASAASAQTVTTAINLNSTTSGTLSQSDSVHNVRSTYYQEFTFSGTAGTVVEIIVASDEIDTYAFLVGPGGQQLAYDDDSAGNLDSRIQVTLPSNGEYRIQATTFSQGTTGPFTVSLSEFIQLPIQAATVAIGTAIDVRMTAQDGQCGDYGRRCQIYEFDLRTGEQVAVDLSETSIGMAVRALDPTQAILWEAGSYYGENNAQTLLARTPGTYSLVVMGTPGAAGTIGIAGAEAASVNAVAPQSIGAGTIAGTLASGDAHAIYNSGVMDLYEIAVEPGQHVQVSLNSADFDAYLRVLDNGDVIAQNDDFEGLNSRVRYRDSGSGNLVVEVSALGGSFGSYELVVELVETAPSTPGRISIGETVQGSLTASDSTQVGGAVQDAYTFEAEEGQRVSIVSQASYGVSMRVISPMGEVLFDGGDYGAYVDPMYYEDYGISRVPGNSSGTGYSGALPASGTYIINLATYDTNSPVSYHLSVRESVVESTPISIGSSVTDSLDATDSWVQAVNRTGDVYSFTLEEPTAIELSLSSNAPAYASIVSQASMNLLDVSSIGDANTRRSIFLAPGNYTAVVSSFEPAAAPYTLSLQATTIDPPRIQPLAAGDSVTGALNGDTYRSAEGSATDYYEVVGASGQTSIGLITSDYSVNFTVVDRTGELVAYGSPTVSGTMDGRATPMTFEAVEGNRYIVVVSSYEPNGAQYRLERR